MIELTPVEEEILDAQQEAAENLAVCRNEDGIFVGRDPSRTLSEDEAARPGRAALVFNGTYTVENRETGEYRTFRVRTQPEESKFAPGKRVVALLSGPENTSDYLPFAFVDDEGVHVWKKKRSTDRSKPSAFEGFATLLWDLVASGGVRYGSRYSLLSEGACIVCNRKLTTPESILTGIGPVCAGRRS